MGIEANCVKNFLRFFQDNRPLFGKDIHSTQMTVRGKRYNYADLDSVLKLIDAETVLNYELMDWHRAGDVEKIQWFQNFIEGTFRSDVIAQREARDKLEARMKGNGKADLKIPDADYIIDHLQPARVLGDTRREAGFKFIDTKSNEMTDYDFWSVSYSLRAAGYDKGTLEEYMQRILHIREDYSPLEPYKMRMIEESNNVYEINLYVPPIWMGMDVEPNLPEDIDKLMTHLFPDEACREFVYTWIYHSLTSRAGTYLYLCGGQGSGKNTLASLISALHGPHNSSNPKQDSFKGRFNYYLKNKRFIFFDEFNCRVRQDKDILKSIINDRVQVEGKNRDHEDIKIHASYFIANNSLEAIGLDPVDRRFSVPNVTHDSIVPIHGRDWIQELGRKFQDPEYLAPFGKWILSEFNKPKWTNEEPYQKDRFEEIVLATARLGLSDMLTKIVAKEQNDYDYYEEREQFRRIHKGQRYPSIQDWKKFWSEVTRGGEKIGEIKGNSFIPAAKYRIKDDGDSI